jgi:hypothetical protein
MLQMRKCVGVNVLLHYYTAVWAFLINTPNPPTPAGLNMSHPDSYRECNPGFYSGRLVVCRFIFHFF